MGVSFISSPLSFETTTDILLSKALHFQTVDNNPLYLSAEAWQAFLKSLYLYFTCIIQTARQNYMYILSLIRT